jgi:hypothetical protein
MFFPPTSEADPATWVAVAAGHVFVGLVLMAFLSLLTGRHQLSALLVSVGYLVFWEGFWQGLGAGVADAVVDSTFVAMGSILGLYAYLRQWPGVATVLVGSLIGMVIGVVKRLRP